MHSVQLELSNQTRAKGKSSIELGRPSRVEYDDDDNKSYLTINL